MKKFIDDYMGFIGGGLLCVIGVTLLILSFTIPLFSSGVINLFAIIAIGFGIFFIKDESENHPDKGVWLKRIFAYLKPRTSDGIPFAVIVAGTFMLWFGITQTDHENLKLLLGTISGAGIATAVLFLYINRD